MSHHDTRPEHVFQLRQALECYGLYQQQIQACDRDSIQQSSEAEGTLGGVCLRSALPYVGGTAVPQRSRDLP